MRIVIGADHGGVPLKDVLLGFLRERGHVVEDVGAFGSEPVDYPDFAVTVANAVVSGRADIGIMIDGAGIGSCMAANKVAGARAAMCYDVTTAANAREHRGRLATSWNTRICSVWPRITPSRASVSRCAGW